MLKILFWTTAGITVPFGGIPFGGQMLVGSVGVPLVPPVPVPPVPPAPVPVPILRRAISPLIVFIQPVKVVFCVALSAGDPDQLCNSLRSVVSAFMSL